ncbi:MAG: PHP domain-containing protein [Deltaproteobacteria bacterium]|nr:PHP domain-containing protein [Deltaproteobacteria bacterium]
MFKIDLHIHTTLGGDSNIQPDTLPARAREVGLDAVCVVEHHSYFLSEPLVEISRKEDFPIFRGFEYRALEGHVLVFGVKAGLEDIPSRLSMQWAVDWINNRNGVAIPAHPYQWGNGFPGDRVLNLTGLAALETLNASVFLKGNQLAIQAAEQLGLNGTAGSDAHGLSVLGRAYTEFENAIGSEEELVQALLGAKYTARWNDEFYKDDHADHWI